MATSRVKVFGVNFADTKPSHVLHQTFVLFLIILLLYTAVNIFADELPSKCDAA